MKHYIILFTTLIFLAACGSNKSNYQDVSQNTLASTFSATDQKMLISTLSQKIITDSQLKEELSGEKPTLLIDVIKNKTSEYIDTQSITDTLKISMNKARLFSILNRDKTNLLMKEQELNQAGLTDSQRATGLGKLWGAKYVLYGNFSAITNYVHKEKQTYYKLTLSIQNIETGEEIWIDEAELNKVSKKSLF